MLNTGGCGFYIKSTLSTIPRKDLSFKVIDRDAQSESHWIEIINDSGPNTIIGVVYCHPSNTNEKFLDNMKTSLKKIKKENKKTLICGDFNHNLLNFDKDQKVTKFLCTMHDYGFQPCITEPTRITNSNKPSLIDNIFINTFENPVSGNILEQISYDHLPNFVILDHVQKKKNNNIMKRDKRNINSENFQADLLDNDLLIKLLNAPDADNACTIFMEKYSSVLNKHAPLKKLSKKKRKENIT